ncbi:MAG TPA: signal peptidase II [Clostridiales bacterium]|nr:signal peptidase II [Clostridiales bacterium]HQP70418.1 signal peptidase II [Clostridiales bacterium]
MQLRLTKDDLKNKYPFFLLSGLIIICDQLSKKFFEKFLLNADGCSVKAVGEEFARFTLAYNTGIAFSIDLGGRYFLTSVSFIASLFIVYLMLKTNISKKLELWAFGMILGGAIGNMIDRAFYGKVVDFIDCDFPDIIMERWPIFNIADSFVTVGMILLAVQYLFLDKKKTENE